MVLVFPYSPYSSYSNTQLYERLQEPSSRYWNPLVGSERKDGELVKAWGLDCKTLGLRRGFVPSLQGSIEAPSLIVAWRLSLCSLQATCVFFGGVLRRRRLRGLAVELRSWQQRATLSPQFLNVALTRAEDISWVTCCIP